MAELHRVVVEAPAKINLHLEITGRRPDGYHTLDTVMQAVDLCDVVVLGRTSYAGIRVTCSRPGVPESDQNLAYKAAVAVWASAGLPVQGLHIHIDKRIPTQAGLGGGSADAAAVLAGLPRLWGMDLPGAQLLSLAARLGADVPFALAGGCALATGIGEEMNPLPPLENLHAVVAKPVAGADTAEAYACFDRLPPAPPAASREMVEALRAGNSRLAAQLLYNVFGELTGDVCTARIREAMLAHGALGAVLSGSGSAVAGLFAGQQAACTCADSLLPVADEVFVARPVSHGARIVYQS